MREIQRYSRFEMFSHVEACRSSKQSQKTYCEQKGIAISTFQYWAKKYQEEFSKERTSDDDTAGFIQVQVQPDPIAEPESVPGQLHFLFPNRIQVMCQDCVSPEVLKILLNP